MTEAGAELLTSLTVYRCAGLTPVETRLTDRCHVIKQCLVNPDWLDAFRFKSRDRWITTLGFYASESPPKVTVPE
eukprot:3399133-Pyramimonas_sp.AAC.4